ncbi:MAG: DUF3021 domain-containing protein [Acetatifactor sp.]|nr:DUF3021 domain-containing protein [Acetatifactor sp.]
MKIWKDMVISTVISIMVAATMFVIAGVVFDLIGKGIFSFENYQFSKMALACVVTGLGFGVPSVLYRIESVPMALATVIQMGIGLAVYLFAALKVGWIPVQAGTVACICTIVGAIVLAFLIWIGFMAYNKSLANKINHALKN